MIFDEEHFIEADGVFKYIFGVSGFVLGRYDKVCLHKFIQSCESLHSQFLKIIFNSIVLFLLL